VGPKTGLGGEGWSQVTTFSLRPQVLEPDEEGLGEEGLLECSFHEGYKVGLSECKHDIRQI
jgi:hypothetical protein